MGFELDDSGSAVAFGLGRATAWWTGGDHPQVDRLCSGVRRVGGFTLDELAKLATSLSSSDLTPNARISGLNLCPSHDNEGSVVMAEIVLPTAILVIGVVAVGACLVYIFSWERRQGRRGRTE